MTHPLKAKAKSRMIVDGKIWDIPVKLRLMSTQEKLDFIDRLAELEDIEARGVHLTETACSLILDAETKEPIYTLEEFKDDSMSDADAAYLQRYAFGMSGLDFGSSEASEELEKN